MADEFMKGLALFCLGGFGWLTFAGWYRTPSFYDISQLFADPRAAESVYDEIGILAGDVFFWLMIIGAVTFWVLVPATREIRSSLAEDTAN
ncbi:DUF7314 family protein [Halorubrum vacuolatum]|uniref:DUF7314 domain-containing protein n=1 Tax=Halorubrum vacuolatum TaxID=63740 RepID=A0A238XU04_HALVU|nr:hypothetical protein [Halorubrum vacuolatum]SNR62485.1 hypothetical protein SAMN06264855_12332 [Halorubrum vacuolatum]